MIDAENVAKAIVVAERISAKANDALDSLDREMTLMKWPADFRSIVWRAVADIASRRAEETRKV